MIWRALLLLFGGLLIAPAAQAEWLEARSRHFILYTNGSEAALRKQSEALERLDWSLRRFLNAEEEPDIDSRKVTVFLIDDDDVKRLCQCRNVAGFYLSRASGSLAFSGKGGWTEQNNQGRLVLFHEYTHHFLLGTYNLAFPSWFSEGFAEFASTLKIEADRTLIGYPAQHRAYGLLMGERIPATEMFDPASRTGRWSNERMYSFYGRGWLMTHYFTIDRDRYVKFHKYLMAMNAGTPSVVAAQEAFGDLKQLDRDLNAYLKQSRLTGLNMYFADAQLPAVAIRKLSPGEAAMLGMRMESVRGVGPEAGKKLYARAAPVAARYPDDPVVQGWFAEMAYDADEGAVSEAAAAKALAREPKSAQALMYRGRVALRQLARDKSTDAAAWGKARASIVAANRVDPDDAEPLWWFWQSFGMEGRPPTPSSIKGLYKAAELAPQDDGVRLAAAVTHIEANEVAEAKLLLRPLAYNPHAGADNPAMRMIAALDAGKSGADVIAAGAMDKEGGDREGEAP